MKKIFTLLSGLFLAAALTTQAQNSTTVTCQIYDWKWNLVGQDQTATLSLDENGVYTIDPFFGSTSSLSFKLNDFGDINEDKERYAYIDFVGNTVYDADNESYDFMSSTDSSKAATCSYTSTAGTPIRVTYPYLYADGYSWVTDFTDFMEHDGWLQYSATICLSGYDPMAKEWIDGGFYIWFLFDKLETSAVAAVEVDQNAPVEYYNLNGQKVQNPANGIFIRKQGAKTEKVVVR